MGTEGFQKYNVWTPLEDTIWLDCINEGEGEWVQASGRVHSILNVRRDAQNNLHKTIHFNTHAVGVGLTSGDRYLGIDARNETLRGEVYEEEFTIAWPAHAIGQGQQNDLSVKILVHVTIHANGEPTVTIERTRVTCK